MEKTVTVGLVDGLHAKTAAIFVQKAGQYQADVHLKKGSSLINGKSILGLMSIVLKEGDEVTLVADGPDENDALTTLTAFLQEKE